MTLHIVLPTVEPEGLVWVTDTRIGLGFDGMAALDKIRYIETRRIACSAWGNKALLIRNELANWIEHGSGLFDLSRPDRIQASLLQFVTEIVPALQIQPSTIARENPGLILATFYGDHARVYFASVTIPPIAEPVENLICIGDEDNPARVFVEHYYQRSSRALVEALSLSVHAMRIAHRIKESYIGDPNAWVFQDGIFRRLPREELALYVGISNTIDAAILTSIRSTNA